MLKSAPEMEAFRKHLLPKENRLQPDIKVLWQFRELLAKRYDSTPEFDPPHLLMPKENGIKY